MREIVAESRIEEEDGEGLGEGHEENGPQKDSLLNQNEFDLDKLDFNLDDFEMKEKDGDGEGDGR